MHTNTDPKTYKGVRAMLVSVIGVLELSILFFILKLAGNDASKFSGSVWLARQNNYFLMILFLTVVLVMSIKISVRLKGVARHDRVFWLHAAFVICYLLSFILSWFFLFQHSPWYQTVLWVLILSFIAMGTVGTAMLIRRHLLE